jgi:hypothetical protein
MRKLTVVLSAVVCALCNCRGCLEDQGPAAAVDLAAPDAALAVDVPRIGGLLKGAEAFITQATRKSGADVLTKSRANFKGQLGFDPLSGQEYGELGVDPEGGAAVFVEGSSPELLVALALRDRGAFDKKIRELIEKTDGANRFTAGKEGRFETVTAGRPFGDEVVPAFHWAYVGRYVIICRDAGRAAWAAALARLQPQTPAPPPSLRTDPTYLSLSRKLPEGVIRIFARGSVAERLVGDAAPLAGAAMTSISLGMPGLSSDTFIEMKVPGLAEALRAPPVKELLGRVAPDAAAVLLTGAASPAGLKALRAHPALARGVDQGLVALRDAIAVDPEAEVVGLLAGPLTVTLSIDNLAGLPQALKGRRSLNTFLDFVHLVVTAEVKDPAAFLSMLDRSRQALETRRLTFRRRTETIAGKEATLFEPDREDPRLGWAVWDRYYVYGAGPKSLERGLATLAQGGPGLGEKLGGSVANDLLAEAGTTVLLVRSRVIAEAATSLAAGAGGPGGAAIIGSLLTVLATLDDVAVAISAEPEGLRLRVRERLQ